MSEPISGGCLCGGVTYEVRDPQVMGTCHCTRCQRWSGGASYTVLVVEDKNFKVTKGQDLVKKYQESGFGDRHFCSNCGSSLFGGGGGRYYVGAGTLKAHGMKPAFHIQVAYKAPWDEIAGDAPQFPEWPPNM
ncbi:MAG: GFA family protein [Acidobacteriota bacterium]